MPLNSPRLWIVATPLGNPGDLSPRAREILENADLILAEDTRRAAQLCRLCGIQGRRFLRFLRPQRGRAPGRSAAPAARRPRSGPDFRRGHPPAGRPRLPPGAGLPQGRSAGFPGAGPSAPAAALSAAGIAPLPHTFLGFLPRDTAGREALLTAYAQVPGSLIFFERKDRLKESLATAARILGPRDLAVCRELTKTHEEFILNRLENSMDLPDELLGEITVIIGRPK